MPLRQDSRLISEFVDELETASWLGELRQQWPKYLVHETSIEHVLPILRRGALLSRNRSTDEKLVIHDNASPEVIQGTKAEVFDRVRLYFRPLTPTFYCNEGFRPTGRYQMGAHCGAPVILLFDSRSVLSIPATRISNGNLARPGTAEGSGIKFLRGLDFRTIYHTGPIRSDENKDHIINSRQCEVTYPDELSLAHLRVIVTRSPAELQTLQSLLDEPPTGEPFPVERRPKITVFPKYFNRYWAYVESASFVGDRLRFDLNQAIDPADRGPFRAHLEVDDGWLTQESFEDPSRKLRQRLTVDLSNYPVLYPVLVTLRLDGWCDRI